MAKFRFKLEKLLRYRRVLEQEAKEALLAATARRVEAEQAVDGARLKLVGAIRLSPDSLEERAALDAFLDRLDNELRSAEVALGVVSEEAETAQGAWLHAKQEMDAIEKLKDKALATWTKNQERKRQADIDEWAAQRKKAA